ncbi:MAG: hypothetical protein ACRD82_11440 [Blastocatellia bacterium]
MLTAYCFGDATAEDIKLIGAHLPKCAWCRRDAQHLSAAVQQLQTDKSLLQFLKPVEMAGAFGLSGKLPKPLGGHRWHAWFVIGLYALLGGLSLVMEFSYEFAQYVWPGLMWAMVTGFWLYATTHAALWCDWKLTFRENVYGLWVAMLLVAAATAALFVAAYLFLPAYSITKLTDAALPAQMAYQKDLIYHFVFLFFFGLPTLHCVWRLQLELATGNHHNLFGLLTGERWSVSPRGLLFPRFWLLFVIALAFFFYSMYAHFNLMSKLQPVSNYALFATFVHLRLVCIYLFIARCLYWYAAQLNELKRECLIADRLKKAGADWQ